MPGDRGELRLRSGGRGGCPRGGAAPEGEPASLCPSSVLHTNPVWPSFGSLARLRRRVASFAMSTGMERASGTAIDVRQAASWTLADTDRSGQRERHQ